MASNRWVAIDPDILTHPLVGAGQPVDPADPTRGAYSRMEAWLWIICNASFADHTVMNRGRKMTLQRGDLLGAWAFLAHTFNWSRKTVKHWIDKLIEDQMLQRRALEEQQARQAGAEAPSEDAAEKFWGNQATILSIVNYWRFQHDGSEKGTPRGHQWGNHQGDQRGHQSAELSASKLADKYVLQQQQGTPAGGPEGTPEGTHITKDTITKVELNNEGMSEPSSDAPADPVPEKPKPKAKRKRGLAYSEQFEVFWSGYPDRTNNDKGKAYAVWKELSEPDQNAAVASLPTFCAYCRKNPTYPVLHALRYLSYRRWEAHLPEPGSTPWWRDKAQIEKLTSDRWRAGIDRYANGYWDVSKLGPPPGHPECIVPARLVSELRLAETYTPDGLRR
jgi:hypothetical protein